IIRRVNGFDRVMIYRFAEDHHGEVIAESTDRHDSYLGLHYPASDIPAPARRHFRLNVVRAIADINADPVPILSADGVAGAADLTFSILRAVPTTHLTYLSNMGVAASMSVSLVSNNALWGLIACHHYEKREVPSQTLRFAELIGGTISALLQGIENRAQLSRAITAEQIAFAMEKEGRGGVALRDVVEGRAPELMHLLDAQGLVFRQSGKRLEHGKVPEPRLSYAPMRRVLQEGVAATDSVHDSLGRSDTDGVAGIGYMELSGDGQDYLVLLRESFEQVVNWAGKPETVEQRLADGSTRLNPRSSFAIWREERSDRSRPFDATDKEALRIIRRALFALNSLEREQAAIAAQKEAEAEEERLRLALLDAARKTSMGELASALAHELNQPLAAVSNYINACRQQLRNFDARIPEGFDDLMLDAVTEASRAADLVRRLRDFIAGGALQVELCDLRGAIRQGADLAMLASGSDRPTLVLDIADDLPRVWIDRIQIGQVILNLTVNAITAMKGSDERLLIIAAHVGEDAVIVTATDTGPGIADQMRPTLFEPFHSTGTTGMGIGLSLCRSIVEAHGGKIHAPQSDRGGVMEFTLPLTRAPEDELAAP
ncbi:MAG: ATP-binding protein, partial [Pseudomonadota bacterium]